MNHFTSTGNPDNPKYLSPGDLDAGVDRNAVLLKEVGKNLGQNAYVLVTACNACMYTDKLPEAIFRLLNGKSKNLSLFTNGTTTSLASHDKIKVRKSLNHGLDAPNTYKPWKVTNSHGTTSLGKRVTPGLDINGLFMWFYTTSSGASTVLGGKKVASPYHPHKFHGKE